MEHDPAHFAPGSFGCHEALHMAHVLAEAVDVRLCEHPAIQAKPHWQGLAALARTTLHELYQAIWAEHTDAQPPAASTTTVRAS